MSLSTPKDHIGKILKSLDSDHAINSGRKTASGHYVTNTPPPSDFALDAKLDSPLGQSNQTVQLDSPNRLFIASDLVDSSSDQSKSSDTKNTVVEPTKQADHSNTPFEQTFKTHPHLLKSHSNLRHEKNRLMVMSYLRAQGKILTSYAIISKEINIPVATLRGILRVLEQRKMITKETFREGKIQGMIITPIDNVKTDSLNRPFHHTDQTPSLNRPSGLSNSTVQIASKTEDFKDSKNLSVYKTTMLINTTKEEFRRNYPNHPPCR